MSANEVLDFRQVVLELGMGRHTVRRLFSDKGGPVYRLPGTGVRVLTTRQHLEAYKAGAPADAPTVAAAAPCGVSGEIVAIDRGPVFS